jgi:hypothetical protein
VSAPKERPDAVPASPFGGLRLPRQHRFRLARCIQLQLAACFPRPGRPKPGVPPLPRGSDDPPGKKPSRGSCSSVSGCQRADPPGVPTGPHAPPGLDAREVGGKFRPHPFSVKPASDRFDRQLAKS